MYFHLLRGDKTRFLTEEEEEAVRILFCPLVAAHDGRATVGGTLEERAEDPADADLLGLLKAAHRSLLHHAHKLPKQPLYINIL